MEIIDKYPMVHKILALKPSQAIALMISVNENPIIRLDQSTYGEIKNEICYGCSAANALLSLSEIDRENEIFSTIQVRSMGGAKRYMGYVDFYDNTENHNNNNVIHSFERSIDDLRNGNVKGFLTFLPYMEENKVAVELIENFPEGGNTIKVGEEGKLELLNIFLSGISNKAPLDDKKKEEFNELKNLLEQAGL